MAKVLESRLYSSKLVRSKLVHSCNFLPLTNQVANSVIAFMAPTLLYFPPMNIRKTTKAVVAALTLTLAIPARAESTFNFDRLESVAREHNFELLAEWVFLDFLAKSIELNLKANADLGISDQERLYIKIPAVLAAGLAVEESERRIGNLIVSKITPDKSAWFSEYAELRSTERTLERQFNQALYASTADVVRLKHELTKVQKALEQKIKVKPGALYRTGRAMRGIGKTTVLLGGAAIAAYAIEDAVILYVGPQEAQATLEMLKARASQIEALANP